MSTDGFEEMCPNCVTPWKCNGPHEFPPAAPEPTNVAGRWDDEGRKFIPGIAVTHTRSSTDAGPDYCDECSAAAGEWVRWPCPASQEPGPLRCTCGTKGDGWFQESNGDIACEVCGSLVVSGPAASQEPGETR